MTSTETAADQRRLEAAGHANQPTKVITASADDDGDEDRADPVDQPLHRRLAGLGVLDQPDDPGQRGIGADGRGAQPPAARAVDRAAVTWLARPLVHWQALAGEQRLVDLGVAVDDDAVDRAPVRPAGR